MSFGEIGEPNGGSFGFGAGGEFEALAMVFRLEEFEAEPGRSFGDGIEVGVGPGVFHVGGRKLGPCREDVGGVGLHVDGLLDLALLSEFGGRFPEEGVVGEFSFADPIFEFFFKALVAEEVGWRGSVFGGIAPLPDAAVIDDEL